MRLWLGIGTFLLGALIWFRSGFSGSTLTDRTGFPRMGLALGSLGLAVMASTRTEAGWLVSSICFALIAVILLSWVLSDLIRRR